ncbi:hypothetical protein M436DRAFT_61173 [Aureobasidium namibiae CBS 147.97]|uniref:Uncharacterized protein n=1 Tax=Aureobasidium namibiae CBS 147.97 TaxID=1043004 RepID=A0A074WRR1_9PEZI
MHTLRSKRLCLTVKLARSSTLMTTISDFVFVPELATNNDFTASATVTNVVYPSSMTGFSGQVVTCQTGVTTISSDGAVLTNCPYTVQSTVLGLTATGAGSLLTAVVSLADYIIELVTITNGVVTTIQTELMTSATTTQTEPATTANSALPIITTVADVTFLLESSAGASTPASSRSSTNPGPSLRPNAPSSVIESTSTSGSEGVSSSPVSTSSTKIGSSSVPYPITNTSVRSTSLSTRSSLNPSVPVSVTTPSVTLVTSSSSSSETSSSLSSAISNSSSLMSSPSPTSSSSLSSSVNPPATNSSTTSSMSTTPVAPLTGCAVASGILGYTPAVSYCSSAYPVTTYTTLLNATITNIVTTSVPTSTTYSSLTLPVQTAVETDQETVYLSSTFSTESTVIETTTTTLTVTTTPQATFTVRRRQAAPSAQASIFSSIMSRRASDIALVCSCLQTPATTSVTSTETVLSTTVATPVVSANNTITPPPVTIQVTETAFITEVVSVTDLTSTTTTQTATATATAPATCQNFFTCSEGVDASCDPNSGGYCLCTEIAGTGQGFCTSFSTYTVGCTTSSDCGENMLCALNTCIGNVCIPNVDAICANPGGQAEARRRFRRGATRRSVWNAPLGKPVDMYNGLDA